MNLSELKPTAGSRKKRKIIGRGNASGHGKTSTKGHKGQKSRSGYSQMRGSEGGQMPLYRRLPKRGFTNPFKKQFSIVNVKDFNIFSDGQEVKPEDLLEKGLIRNTKLPVKVLGVGELKIKVKILASKFSKTAAEKVKKSGGDTITIGKKQ
ncbi:MAG: 50S ribosomal protein L15 [Candidatus Aureabacteria bacterium]|nr:50S ribosomal protein L15 [Candidatus Auribacterota bacterium]